MFKFKSNVYIKVIYDRKKKAGKDGEGVVEIRVTYQRRQKYINTGVYCRAKNWKSEMVVGRLDAHEMNVRIDSLLRDVRRVVNEMQEDGRVVEMIQTLILLLWHYKLYLITLIKKRLRKL